MFVRNLLSMVALLAAVCLFAAPSNALTIESPVPVPTLALEEMDGASTGLDKFAGEVVVLNFFATWCAPCREEMPALDNLQAKLDGHPVRVVALSVDRASPAKVQKWLDDIGVVNLTILRDPSLASMREMAAPGLPATFIIDRNGEERARHYGIEVWDADHIVQSLIDLASEGAS